MTDLSWFHCRAALFWARAGLNDCWVRNMVRDCVLSPILPFRTALEPPPCVLLCWQDGLNVQYSDFFFFFRIVGWSYDFWVLFLSFIEQLQTRTWLTVNCSMMRLCHDENKTGFTNTINIRQLLIRLSTAQPFACFQLHPMNFKRKLHSWTAKRGSKYAPNGRRSKSGDLHNYVYSFTTGDSIIPF
jgi:hypothetical protein